jgi:phosphate starvation-inducible membrane PsiE
VRGGPTSSNKFAHLIEGLYNDHEDCLAGKFEIVGIIAALAEEILLFEFLHLIAECFESKIHGSERDPSASESTDVIVETANEAHDVERRPYIRQRRQLLLGPAHHTAPGAAAVPAVLLVEAEELLSAPLLPQDQPGRPVPGPIAAAPESNEPRQRDWYSLMLIVYYIVALVSLFVRGLTGHEFYITYTTEGDPVEFGLYAAYFDMSINVLLTCGILWFERRRLIVSEHQEKAQALWIAVPLLALVALNGLYFGTRVAEHSHAYRSMGAEFVNVSCAVRAWHALRL